MSDATRDLHGEPRFTRRGHRTGVGPGRRVYAGFGNVIQNPAKFDLHASGFQLSTRHIGLDFANGLSLLQACDVFPDLLQVDPDARVYALRTHHDALIGHLDAGESDHMGWTPGRWRFAWGLEAGDAERVSWHDMASHGAFVLLGGGLGHRYSGEQQDPTLHGYASDDYLSMTVLGGRNPMCDGPFSRRAVMTYWLLHDVCARVGATRDAVARVRRRGHPPPDRRVRRRRKVIANRGRHDWQIAGQTLPAYGFVAQARGRPPRWSLAATA